ncbi:MAG: T9SS type A sorting domain-containing protein [Chitinophagales bacterium]|nr:T9SS type A sorting domain-containing protein [Chitinophagales bacterium]
MSKVFFTILSFFIASVTSNLSAQNDTLYKVFIANGGTFEFNPPFVDRTSVGVYEPYQEAYSVVDSVQVESVQDMVSDGEFVYLAAQDSIIKYNVFTNSRVASIPFAGILSLHFIDNYLIAGKYYGAEPFVVAYSKNLDSLFAISGIDNTVSGVAKLGDSLYVSFNVTGSSFIDTLGRLAVVDLNTKTLVKIVELDTAGAGATSVFAHNGKVYIIASNTGNLLEYDVTDGGLTTYHLDITDIGYSNWFELHNGLLYAQMGNAIATFNFNNAQTNTVLDLANLSSPSFFLAAAAFDTINQHFYLTYSDYATGGYCLVYDTAATRIDSFQTGIASEALALVYRTGPVGVEETKAQVGVKVFPNPFGNEMVVEYNSAKAANCRLTDLSGHIWFQNSINSSYHIDTKDLPAGIYLLHLENSEFSSTKKLLKF